MKSLLPLLALLTLCGCATVKTARPDRPTRSDGNHRFLATTSIENYGYYLFGAFPLIGGNHRKPNLNTTSLFQDNVTLQNNIAMLAEEAQRLNAADVINIKSEIDWTGSFSFWLIWRKTIYTSADFIAKD